MSNRSGLAGVSARRARSCRLGRAAAHFLAQIDAARLLHFRGMPTRPLAGVTLVALLSLTVTACGGGDELDSRSASLGLAQPTNAFGLTFGQALGETPPGTIAMSCHGAPKGVENPHAGSCNPYAGDTRCDHALPILCVKRDARPAPPGFTSSFYNGWVHGELASSAPVVGRALTSSAAADAVCAHDLGPAYRMAEFHDGDGGWAFTGAHGGVMAEARHWVRIDDQPGNCWDAASSAAAAH